MPETITWVDADGVSHVLSDQPDLNIMRGMQGRFLPPVDLVTQEVPLQAGARLRTVKTKVREVAIPIEVWTANDVALRTRLRSLLPTFDPNRGDGKLRVTAPDGSQRELTCRYSGGLELDEGPNNAWTMFQRAVVVFAADDPYWYDLATVTDTFTIASGTATFFPLFPLRLTSSTVFATATVTNSGDVDALPSWTVNGPGSSLVVENQTTGQAITLGTTLAVGEFVVIDTAAKTVTDQDGTNLYGSLDPASAFWPLLRGSNSIAIQLSGATSTSSVVLSYRQRYLTP